MKSVPLVMLNVGPLARSNRSDPVFLSRCLTPLPPAPLSIFGSSLQERTPRACLPGCKSQKLAGEERRGGSTAPPRFSEV